MIKYIDHHVHTTNSLLDGMVKIDEYVNFGVENEFPALFISDHGNMDGAINFYITCKDKNIKPIIGSEFYVSEGILDEKDDNTKHNFHLCLYAKNFQGYKNLVKLTTWANINNYYYKPRITFDVLKQYSEGLICTTACIGSQWGYLIENDKLKEAGELAYKYKQLFKDDFYIELGYANFQRQIKYVNVLNKIAEMLNIKTLIGNDVHYLKKEELFAHKIIICKGVGKTVDFTENNENFNYTENYYKTAEEIKEIFKTFQNIDVEKCFKNTYEIIDKCENYEIKFGEYIYPELPNTNGLSQAEYLFKSIKEGCIRRYNGNVPKEVINRIQYEFSIINKMNFCGYFNMVKDYIMWAKLNNIKVGAGRGSCAGCLIAYIIGITDVDSLKYDLFFERFLNPDRVSFPDIDTDFEPDGRGKVIQYLTEKYGQNGCVPISTRGYLKGKSAIKTVASKLGLDFNKYNSLLKGIDDPKIDTVDKVLESDEQLQKIYNTDEEFRNVITLAKQIEGNIQSIGVHASGVIVCHKDISEITPIIKTKDGYATGYTDKIVEKLGLIKYDILGLKNLVFIKETEARVNKKFDFNTIPLDDKKTYQELQKGNNLGIFQLESDGMKNLLIKLKPENIKHIEAIVALYRPGAMQFIEEYIANKNDSSDIKYFDERLKPVLKDTYAQMVYQEQVMKIAQILAGYTMSEADSLRRAIGKKKLDEMMKHEDKFINGCVKHGVERNRAEELYKQIVEFANYSFNKSHAISYAILSYTTAYLKANYPLQYMTALLNANSDSLDKLNPYTDECYRLGIDVLPPDINKSSHSFEHDEDMNVIRFGFNGIKGVGNSSIEPILAERNNGDFVNLEDLLNRMPSMNKSAIESLIKCGAFNTIEENPYKYLPVLEFFTKAKSKADYKKGNINYYDCLIRCYVENILKNNNCYKEIEEAIKNIKGTKKEDKEQKQELKNKLEQFIQYGIKSFKNSEGQKPSVSVLKENEMEILGFPISNNPKKEIIALQDFIDNDTLYDIKNSKDYTSMFYFIGRIKSIKRTKNGSYFAILTDDNEEITTFIKKETYLKLEDKLTQPSNYFRICGTLNKSYNPERFDDSFKIEGLRYFNTSKDSEIILKTDMSTQQLSTVLTKIKESGIIELEDINYRLNILRGNEKLTTKIDYWVKDLQSISSFMIEYNMIAVTS